MKRNRFTGILWLLLSSYACRSVLKSDLTVQPGRQFVLGGNQKGAFSVRANNKGSVPVNLLEQRADGQLVSLGQVAPGQTQTIRLAAGAAVRVDNASSQPARLDLTVTGEKENLTMQEQTPAKP